MSDFTDFFPAAGGGGGGIPKYQEFTASGTFTPSHDLIDVGGRIAYIVVGGGQKGYSGSQTWSNGGNGGAVIYGYTTLTGTTGCAITIGAGGTASNGAGGDSSAAFASAGGTAVTAKGGAGGGTGIGGNPAAVLQDLGTRNSTFSAHPGVMGFGKGGGGSSNAQWQYNGAGGNYGSADPGENGTYGAGTSYNQNGNNGFVRITWFE